MSIDYTIDRPFDSYTIVVDHLNDIELCGGSAREEAILSKSGPSLRWSSPSDSSTTVPPFC